MSCWPTVYNEKLYKGDGALTFLMTFSVTQNRRRGCLDDALYVITGLSADV